MLYTPSSRRSASICASDRTRRARSHTRATSRMSCWHAWRGRGLNLGLAWCTVSNSSSSSIPTTAKRVEWPRATRLTFPSLPPLLTTIVGALPEPARVNVTSTSREIFGQANNRRLVFHVNDGLRAYTIQPRTHTAHRAPAKWQRMPPRATRRHAPLYTATARRRRNLTS